MRATLLLAAALLPLANALGQKQIISLGDKKGHDHDYLQLAGKGVEPGQIRVSSNDYWGVIRAAGDLAADFGKATGKNLSLSNGERGAGPAEYEFRPVNVSDNTVVRVNFYHLAHEASLLCLADRATCRVVLDDWQEEPQGTRVLGPRRREDRHHCRNHWPLRGRRQTRQAGQD